MYIYTLTIVESHVIVVGVAYSNLDFISSPYKCLNLNVFIYKYLNINFNAWLEYRYLRLKNFKMCTWLQNIIKNIED